MIPIGITGARFQLIHAQNPIIRDPAWLIHDPAWLTGDPNRDHGRSAFGSPMHGQRTNFSRQVAARVGPHFAAAGMQPRVRRVQPAQIAGQESVMRPSHGCPPAPLPFSIVFHSTATLKVAAVQRSANFPFRSRCCVHMRSHLEFNGCQYPLSAPVEALAYTSPKMAARLQYRYCARSSGRSPRRMIWPSLKSATGTRK